jgi:hypothetical protein
MGRNKENRVSKKVYGEIKGSYSQSSVKKRIEAFFLDNIGKVVIRQCHIQL